MIIDRGRSAAVAFSRNVLANILAELNPFLLFHIIRHSIAIRISDVANTIDHKFLTKLHQSLQTLALGLIANMYASSTFRGASITCPRMRGAEIIGRPRLARRAYSCCRITGMNIGTCGLIRVSHSRRDSRRSSPLRSEF